MIPFEQFSKRLVAWQLVHGRHDLPWQSTRDPYQIWVSEIMLQQTRVKTVIPYYRRFIKQFPNVLSLASADEDTILALWSGLGYYSRARNLYRSAKEIVIRYGDTFPSEVSELIMLPGIGKSTAAAIVVFAFGMPEAILDGNVKRVLARAYGIEGFPGKREVEIKLWKLAKSLLPKDNDLNIRIYTQGLMDLGAILCKRVVPVCTHCPFSIDCVAYLSNKVNMLPTPGPNKSLPYRVYWMLLLEDKKRKRVLLEKRSPTGFWGCLWSLPEASNKTILSKRTLVFGGANQFKVFGPFEYAFSNFKMKTYICADSLKESDKVNSVLEKESILFPHTSVPIESRWIHLEQLNKYGLPAPIKKVLNHILFA